MFLEAKTTSLIDSLEIAVVKFLNSITERYSEPAAPAPQGLAWLRVLRLRGLPDC